MKPFLFILALALLTGCMRKSDALLELMNSPFYGAIVDYLEYRPLRVEHIDPHTP